MPYIKRGIIHFSREVYFNQCYLPSTNLRNSSDIREVFDARATPGLLRLVGTQINKAQEKGLGITVSSVMIPSGLKY